MKTQPQKTIFYKLILNFSFLWMKTEDLNLPSGRLVLAS